MMRGEALVMKHGSAVRPAAMAAMLAACGGAGAATPATTPDNQEASPVGSPWDAVFTVGATSTLYAEHAGAATIETTAVRQLAGFEVAELSWSHQGEVPTRIVRAADGVQIYSDADDEALEAMVPDSWWFPDHVVDGPNGDLVEAGQRPGELCFEEGPADDAGDCEDVCFARMCIVPGVGITQVSGRWAPDWELFEAAAP